MCTLSFIPSSDGYVVAMNRDELLSRGVADPPSFRSCEGKGVIHPQDVSGGTWIAVNEEGTTWALLNWNLGATSMKERSRGEVVLKVASISVPELADARISAGSLQGIAPFRLFGISFFTREVREWRWSGMDVQRWSHPWERSHWFSSGRSDELASRDRGQVFQASAREPDSGTLAWLRRIHASHLPRRGAFSVCVHRSDAATVSYTEIEVSPGSVSMVYRAGSPCNPSTPVQVTIPARLRSEFRL